MSVDFRLGIQSYCFRTFKTIDALIDALKTVGLKYVEIWPGHLDPNADKAELTETLNVLSDNGITMDSFGVFDFTKEETQTRKAM